MENKNLYLVLAILTCIVEIIFNFFNTSSFLFIVLSFIIAVERLAWLYIFYQNSTLRHSPFARKMYIGVALLFLASLFKLQHWPNAQWLYIAAFVWIISIYSFHFF